MPEIFGGIAGSIHLACEDDRSFRDALDTILTNGLSVTANPRRRLLSFRLGEHPGIDDEYTDLTQVQKIIDVLLQRGRLVTEEIGINGLREGER